MDHPTFTALQHEVAQHDRILRGDGNGNPGLVNRVRTLETRDADVREVIKEWREMKATLKGAKIAAVVFGIILTALGGGLGVAILQAVSKVAAGLP